MAPDHRQYFTGIDIGSTTVKLVVLSDDGRTVFADYCRHHARIRETLCALLKKVKEELGDIRLAISVTGSGAMGLSDTMNIPFIQEVIATSNAVQRFCPETDVAIELGGEDAKIIYFRNGLDERMNGVCAGGTGSFIDQMADLLQTDAAGLNEAAKESRQVYKIAARCGVFAKTDIQPLINEGAGRPDLAASVFQAVVNQTVSGLACGKPIRGHVAFLGGPLHYLSELKRSFINTLSLMPNEVIDPKDSHLFAAKGAALSREGAEYTVSGLMTKLETDTISTHEIRRLEPLFSNKTEYEEFLSRHEKSHVSKAPLSEYKGNCFLGIDAGSTTTKLVLIGENGELLFSYYSGNFGNPVETAIKAIKELAAVMPKEASIARTCSTGYGEALIKEAFRLDEGEVETVAHTEAAAFFDPLVDCVLDIGGQDMKCIRLKDHTIDNVLLNEACSSGCGSFLENFASSLNMTVEEFANEALFAPSPIDLGTRCTVFMNSNVKQAQKEGASVADISAGLSYSVIKNALFKVIKLSDAKDLGSHIVVQGGTFCNKAVLRAFEKVAGCSVVCPDISELMGAFGAALIARLRYCGGRSGMRSFEEIENLSYSSKAKHCGGCENNCMLIINKFEDGGAFISGNRCEKNIASKTGKEKGVNLFEYKRNRIFSYEPLSEKEAVRGTLGLPRVLNMYENYPFWAVFFRELKFRTILSPYSSRHIYEMGMESIPSESECYPAKLSHGHVQWLYEHGVGTVFHPCVFYEYQETPDAQHHYNCPMVAAYPENLKNNVEAITSGKLRYIRPFMAFTDEKTVADRLIKLCRKEWGIPAGEVRKAVHMAWMEQRKVKSDIAAKGEETVKLMEAAGKRGIVLAGRPYHIDPEINHGIPELVSSYGFYVFTEDSLPLNDLTLERPLRVVDQWVFHSRLYNAAEYVTKRDDMELIQLFSFGCGLDAVTTDQVQEILERSGKLYTVLKIDEVGNLGAVKIRIRSLIAAMDVRARKDLKAHPEPLLYEREEFTQKMYEEEYTLLAPKMSPIHFELLEPILVKFGYHVVLLDNDTKGAVDAGLKYVNNDACYPSIITTGQMMEAVLSGKYDTDKLALIMSQTGGCCRASNYVSFIRRALKMAGLSHIPVISFNVNGMEKNSGFKLTAPMLFQMMRAIILGDIMMRCIYRVRPYEIEKGSADRLHEKWKLKCIRFLKKEHDTDSFADLCRKIVHDFDVLPIDGSIQKPRVGVVGEILVKYMPLANNHLVELLEEEGAEVIVPDLLDFFSMCLHSSEYRYDYLGGGFMSYLKGKLGVNALETLRKPAVSALKKSTRFSHPIHIEKIAEPTKPFLSMGNQYGEGWFLCGEMIELLNEGIDNIVCIQPFGCLPNHVMGKGVINALKSVYPQANIAAVDYDPGASEVNQRNRIKLLLSAAKEQMKKGSR